MADGWLAWEASDLSKAADGSSRTQISQASLSNNKPTFHVKLTNQKPALYVT